MTPLATTSAHQWGTQHLLQSLDGGGTHHNLLPSSCACAPADGAPALSQQNVPGRGGTVHSRQLELGVVGMAG